MTKNIVWFSSVYKLNGWEKKIWKKKMLYLKLDKNDKVDHKQWKHDFVAVVVFENWVRK